MYNLIYCAYLIRYILGAHPKKEQLSGSQIISRLFDIIEGEVFNYKVLNNFHRLSLKNI